MLEAQIQPQCGNKPHQKEEETSTISPGMDLLPLVGTPSFPAHIPSLRWSQRQHLLCLRLDVPEAFDVQTMIMRDEEDESKPIVVVISCFGAAPSLPPSKENDEGKEVKSEAFFYQLQFEPAGLLAPDVLDTCRIPTTVTDSYVRIHFPKTGNEINWQHFGTILPNAAPIPIPTSSSTTTSTIGGGTTPTTRVVYDWDYCEGYLRSKHGEDSKGGNEEDDGIADPVINATKKQNVEDKLKFCLSVDIHDRQSLVDEIKSTAGPIEDNEKTSNVNEVMEETTTVDVIKEEEEDASSNVSSLDSDEIEEDFANGLMEQLAEEQGMQLTPDFYETYMTRKIETKKRRNNQKIMANMMKGKECECEQQAVLDKVKEFAKEMESRGGSKWASMGDNDDDLREASRVYNEIMTAKEKTTKGRAALAALAAQSQHQHQPMTTTTSAQSGGPSNTDDDEATPNLTSSSPSSITNSTLHQKDPETVEEALALLFPFTRWNRMIKKNGLVKSTTVAASVLLAFVANVVRWALGLGPVSTEVPLTEDAVVKGMFWSFLSIIAFGYILLL